MGDGRWWWEGGEAKEKEKTKEKKKDRREERDERVGEGREPTLAVVVAGNLASLGGVR